jgi:predicted lipoprotein with Yx(FWY)xxD motif
MYMWCAPQVRTNISTATRLIRIGRLRCDGTPSALGDERMQLQHRPVPIIPSRPSEGTKMTTRKYTLFASALVASLALFAAACGGSGGGSSNASQATTPNKSTSSATVAVANSDLGNVLVDAQGRTLYLFGADMGTTSTCSGACAQEWPPLMAGAAATVGNGAKALLLGTTTRSDGSKQITYNGHPVYLFAGDHKAGDTNGQGITAFGGTWYALTGSGNHATASAASGSEYGY